MQLKTARKRAGLTQTQLAKASGVDQRTISRLENGEIAEPSHNTAVRVCRGLGMAPCHTCGLVNTQAIDEFKINGHR